MGFLDDLKRQADAAKAQQGTNAQALGRNTALADAACNGAFKYLVSLAQQLNVLQPRSKAVYQLDRRHRFDQLELTGFRADARRKRLRGEEVFDHVVLRWTLASHRTLALTKDFVPDIEQIESRLRQGGVRFDSEAVRNPVTAKLQEMRYGFVADFAGSALLTPDHDRGSVRFELVNLDGFGTVTVDFPAFEVGTARLDELARWILGEPNTFLKEGAGLRRTEA